MGRPIQTVKVFAVQDRRGTSRVKLGWVVRLVASLDVV
jgi:hypothetical protein